MPEATSVSALKLLLYALFQVQCECRRPTQAQPALHPDPRSDAVRAICYVIQEDGRGWLQRRTRGCIVCVPPATPRHVIGARHASMPWLLATEEKKKQLKKISTEKKNVLVSLATYATTFATSVCGFASLSLLCI
jgi:hypothetical protein